jgi:hypothetical protein
MRQLNYCEIIVEASVTRPFNNIKPIKQATNGRPYGYFYKQNRFCIKSNKKEQVYLLFFILKLV